jgi:Leucine carboxyl methyltransferase
MPEPGADEPAVQQARWLIAVHDMGGAAVTEEDLRSRISPSMREAHGWDDVDAFRTGLTADGAVMTGVRVAGQLAVIDVRTPGGLRLERVLRADPDGRLASMTTRLAGGASMTMVSAAAWRAAHLAFDDPVLLEDSFAGPLIGDASPYQFDAVRDGTHGTRGFHYRWNMAARARLAEDTLSAQRAAVGAGQYVLLGAGLDTFALRNPYEDVTVFEVDTPASQGWKLDRLAQLGIPTPPGVRYFACDF